MMKLGEDQTVQEDGTVRDASGQVYQFSYGEDNLDGAETVVKKGVPVVCDIVRMAQKLNGQYEVESRMTARWTALVSGLMGLDIDSSGTGSDEDPSSSEESSVDCAESEAESDAREEDSVPSVDSSDDDGVQSMVSDDSDDSEDEDSFSGASGSDAEDEWSDS